MKTAKEYMDRIGSDGDFAAQIAKKLEAAAASGAEDMFAAVSRAAAELGYEISPEQLKEFAKEQQGEGLSDEELSKIAGGKKIVRPTVVVS